ncbi:MAG: methylglyoxal synthase [Erysipelotrichaceae bacterium]
MKQRKRIGLIAHDARKAALVAWVKQNKQFFLQHDLIGTGTTANLLAQEVGLDVEALNSGPLGGDQQIGARIVEGRLDFMIFFWDPLSSQPHDPDVKALLRIAALYDILVATNQTTADFILHSSLMHSDYQPQGKANVPSLAERLALFQAEKN